jgi:hypothetical protein
MHSERIVGPYLNDALGLKPTHSIASPSAETRRFRSIRVHKTPVDSAALLLSLGLFGAGVFYPGAGRVRSFFLCF